MKHLVSIEDLSYSDIEVLKLKSEYNKVPGLTVILIGDLTPSQIYVRTVSYTHLTLPTKA